MSTTDSIQKISRISSAIDITSYFPECAADSETLAELQDYHNDLSVLADFKVSIQFTNRGKDHAALVMAKIFESAFSEVRIFAKNFNGAISNNRLYLEKLEAFLRKKPETKVKVIFEDAPSQTSKALGLLRAINTEIPGKVILKIANPRQIKLYRDYLVNPDKMMNFTIADNSEKEFAIYRCETDVDRYVAILNFDDSKFCKQLVNLFSILDKDAQILR